MSEQVRLGFGHEVDRQASDDWLTPPYILEALGPFDLDPCASMRQTRQTARHQFTQENNGLKQEWKGRVWCNPPYRDLEPWLRRMANHGNGIALTYARTETRAFEQWVWPCADAMLFFFGRIAFFRPGKHEAKAGPGPSVLVAYGKDNADALYRCGLRGAIVGRAALAQEKPEAEDD
jgi:phage N-6-adenine-methyltransferase